MTMEYRVLVDSSADSKVVENIISTTFSEIDRIYNKWNLDSEISKINRADANVMIPLSPELEQFLLDINYLHKLTQGGFDPTIESAQKLWKKFLSEGNIPPLAELNSLKPSVGWSNIQFEAGALVKKHSQTAIDLGGVAKGYAIDLILERLQGQGYQHLYVEWGGEIRVAGKHPEGRVWGISIRHLPGTTISLSDGAVATSGDYFQYWTVEGITYYHIFNPKTCSPLQVTPDSIMSVTVVAPSCLLADVLATSAMLFPNVNQAMEWSESITSAHEEIQFYFIPHKNGD